MDLLKLFYVYFALCQKNQAKVWLRFQSLLKLLLWTWCWMSQSTQCPGSVVRHNLCHWQISFFTDISKLFRLVYQKGAKNATWHFNKLGPWANWMSGSLQSLIQHQKQLLWEFPLSNFYQFRPFTPKWNLRLLPSSLNFLNISGSFKCYRGGRKTFSRGKKQSWRKKMKKKTLSFSPWVCCMTMFCLVHTYSWGKMQAK